MMDQKSKSEFHKKLERLISSGEVTPRVGRDALSFYESYSATLKKNGIDFAPHMQTLLDYLDLLQKQEKEPFPFESFHKRVTEPFNYHAFGLNFWRPLIDFENSSIRGMDHLEKIVEQEKRGENIVFFANHQVEPDPQVIALLLEKPAPRLSEEIIIVAGERVLSDAIAAPFSMGCNLLCIYSKRHIHSPPEKKHEKQRHNQKTMRIMGELFAEGGKCIYVAPSGGRDRKNAEGVLEVAPFDSPSIEMFYLMARHSKIPTHFYPLALSTYPLLPPPDTVRQELGEERHTAYTPVHMAIGEEIDMKNFPGSVPTDKNLCRKLRAEYIHDLVEKDYNKLPKGLS